MEYYVSKPTSFMHLYPDAKSEVTDELLYGMTVVSFDESYAGFLLCKTEYGYLGYVDVSDLKPKKTSGDRYIVTSPFCDVYRLPQYRFAPEITIPHGGIIEGKMKTSRDEKFVCINDGTKDVYLPSGNIREYKSLAHFESSDEKRSQIVKNAFFYLGTPYRWGGKSTFGIDCSGLCFMAYTMCGLSLYRDAEPDARYVKKIPFEELKPADLIYYNGHVTMYTGLGEYIHSSATLGGVRISSFDENSREYYPKLRSDIVCCARSLYLS